MKNILYILIFFISICCSAQNKLNDRNSIPKKLVFKKSIISEQIDSLKIYSETDNLVISKDKKLKDSITKKIREEILKANFIPKSQSIEIHIDIQNDSIWRHKRENGKMIGDYFMIKRSNGILYYYDKSKSINYRKYDLFAQNDEYLVSENRKDRKEINGFDCFKLTLVRKDSKSDLGDTIYEMYVTELIDLPAHTVINLTKEITNVFPLEIKISEKNLSGMAELYELIEMK